MTQIKILGAGISGLTAAINLAKNGKIVKVFEIKDAVGKGSHPSVNAFIGKGIARFEEVLEKCCLSELEYSKNEITKFRIVTKNNDVLFVDDIKNCLVNRGNKNSIEYKLYKLAKKHGVEFEFNTKLKEHDVDIVATGPKTPDIVVYGNVYKNTTFPKNQMIIVRIDKYSPVGWYMYTIPHENGNVEIINCVSTKNPDKAKKLFIKAIEELECFKTPLKNAEQLYEISGFGNANYLKTCISGGRLYIGEAAGFQDVLYGYGMHYAMLSGKIAADSIILEKNYDEMWKQEFSFGLKKRFAMRFIISLFGNRITDMYITQKIKGNNIGEKMENGINNNKYIVEILFRLGLLKKKITGHW
jgi:flavin-dependent dehydrogenase